MPRNRVFISYSHKDEEFLQNFLVHLEPSLRDEQLDTWIDREDIVPGDDWHKEIQQSLESAAVGVLLVSPDFLASDYIYQHELPILLQAREEGRIELTCLYVRHSRVDEDARQINVTLSSGETVPVKLTKYQGLNQPDNVVASLDANERDKLYAKAASDLEALVAQKTPKPGHSPTGQRFALTIQLQRSGRTLTRSYFDKNGRITEYTSDWNGLDHQDVGSSLFDTLFGSERERYEQVLQTVFGSELGSPIRYPVRIRIHTHDATLAALPWRATSWEGYPLYDQGWTFELITDTVLQDPPDQAEVTLLKAPCPVLMIAPGTTPDVTAHRSALEEQLQKAWPFYDEKPHYADTWETVRHAWRLRQPRIVYYYGPAENDGQTLALLFNSDNGIEQRPITDLAQLWERNPPEVVFFNFVDNGVSTGTALSQLHAPLIISQNGADSTEARRSALEWFHEVLEEDEHTDPVWALHQYGLTSAVAWGAYGHWQTRTVNEPPKEALARLLLDRKAQRALGHDAVGELVREGDRRLYCVLAYGTEGNLVDQFTTQLLEHLHRNAKEVALVQRLQMHLPPQQTFDVTKLAFEVRRRLSMRDRDTFGTALAQYKPHGPGRARPVLLLDWGVRGTSEANRIDTDSLEAWLEFCSQQLSRQCPRDLRLISCLSIEIVSDSQVILEEKIEELRADPRFRDRSFRLELLPPLDHIRASDLADFLDRRGNSSCPDDLISTMPELIVNKTGGQFSKTVALIEQAERSGWNTLRDELLGLQDTSPSDTSSKNKVL